MTLIILSRTVTSTSPGAGFRGISQSGGVPLPHPPATTNTALPHYRISVNSIRRALYLFSFPSFQLSPETSLDAAISLSLELPLVPLRALERAEMSKLSKVNHAAGIFADMSVDGPPIGTLIAIIDRAKNLPNRKTMGKQNPYCAARLGKEAKKTPTDLRGGQTPRW